MGSGSYRSSNSFWCIILVIDNCSDGNAGRAVINAAESGISFPLKKRDQLLDYILTLMHRNDEEGFSDLSVELLHTQVFNALLTYLLKINLNIRSCLFICFHFMYFRPLL